MRVSIKYLMFLFLLLVGGLTYGQEAINEGEITFMTSNNTYVRFTSTDGIEVGDTLKVLMNDIYNPCLIVEQKSSTSCVCRKLESCTLEQGFKVFHNKTKNSEVLMDTSDPEEESVNTLESEIFDTDSLQKAVLQPEIEEVESRESIRARTSLSSYSNLEENNDRHSVMMRFSLNADHIRNSNFSLNSYVNYRKNIDANDPDDPRNSLLRIYNLALRYENDSSSMSIIFGRNINPRMSSVGAVDGLQVNRYFNKLYTGAIVGFRPDVFEFGFNSDLLEYGFYVGSELADKNGRNTGRVTAGFLEQRNTSEIDRRYSYFQFSNSFNRNFGVFASGEIDLYSRDLVSNTSFSPQLTNIFMSLRYRFNRRISVNFSFDSRKRIIYYETLRTELERLLADDEARQGIRVRLNFRPINLIYMGLSYSKRFQNSSQNKSDNYNGFLSLTRIPGIDGRLNFGFNLNKSNFQNSLVYTIRHSRTIVRRKLDVEVYYRYAEYNYFNTETKLSQYYAGGNLSWNITRDIGLNLLFEHSASGGQNRNRINTKLIKRFR